MASPKAHILVYPFPESGHIIPLLDLTDLLLNHGLNITVSLTSNTLSLLDPLLSRHLSSLQPLLLPSPPQPSAGPGPVAMMHALRDRHYPILLEWFRSHQSPPVAIISDFFLGWTHQLASEVGVARVVFSPSSAFGMSMFFTLWRDLPEVDDPDPSNPNENSLLKLENFPHCSSLSWYQVPSLYRISKKGEAVWQLIRNIALEDMASWGIVLNASTQMEGVYVQNIKKQLGHHRVWAVGPVLPQDGASANRGGSSSVPCHQLMSWLDTRKEGSVVYVSFGSYGVLTKKQMDPLAIALEKSGVNFILCVKQPKEMHMAGACGDIPDGFEDRVAGRGYIIKGWAPQMEILRHQAVAAFLTHCCWNSTLEGIAAGVLMLTWPMAAEQFLNAKLLVEQLGVGIRVAEGTQNIPESTELTRLLVESIDESRPERMKAQELRDVVLGSVAKGGTSDRDLDEFIRNLNALAT